MLRKSEGFFLLYMLGLGAFLTFLYLHQLSEQSSTPEAKLRRLISSQYSDSLCEKIEDDIESFKQYPYTFQRASIISLDKEVRRQIKILLKNEGVEDDTPITPDFKAVACSKDIDKWLNISSAGTQSLDEERKMLDIVADGQLSDKPDVNMHNVGSNTYRVALVIGNSKYRQSPLKNPVNDADDMSKFLIESQFKVIDKRDATLKDMRDGIGEFADDLMNGSVGLIYYSGHGLEYKGRNYLVPVDALINNEDEIPRQTVDASTILERIGQINGRATVFIIDACRTSFVATNTRNMSSGLARMDGLGGSLIAFSTAPGHVAEDGNGRNSPYTSYLIKEASIPGRRIEDVFKETARKVEKATLGRQVPWYSSSLLVDFSLR
jgi:hypothetical protein